MLTQNAHYFDRVDNRGSCDTNELNESDDGTSHTGHKLIVV